MSTNERAALITQLSGVEARLRMDVGIRLGQWAGLGDWRCLSEESRLAAATEALAEVDMAIRQLAAFRSRLADHLGPRTPTT